MEFKEVKQLLEDGVDEVYTHPVNQDDIIFLAFRIPQSANLVREAATYLNDKGIVLSICCGNDLKINVTFNSHQIPLPINIKNILGATDILSLGEGKKISTPIVRFHIYEDQDKTFSEQSDDREDIFTCWTEIPFNVFRVKIAQQQQ